MPKMERIRPLFAYNFVKYKRPIHLSSMSSSPEKKISEDPKCDIIGPPNKISNLRPVIFHIPKNESPIEKEFRLKREEVHKWNDEFWSKHNTKFFEQKKKFTENHLNKHSDNSAISSDEMSVFYKKFLDEHWKAHQVYNAHWYRQNFGLLILALRVFLFKVLKRTGQSIGK